VPLDTIAPHEFSATIGGRLPDQNLTFGWTTRLVAAQKRTNGDPLGRQPTPSFQVHDAFLTWKPDEGTFENFVANLRVDNIFDKDCREYLSGTPAKGRTFKVALARQFTR